MLAQAPATAPKPNPELKKLAVLVGHWTYEGEYKPGLIGPGGKITGEYTGEMILGGFFLKAQESEKGAMGESRFLEIDGYDPVNKNLTFTGFQDDGSTYSGVLTVNGNTVTWTGKYTVAGKQYLFKEPFILAPDLMSGTVTSEVSVDGHTWTLFFESKWTKVKPAVKK
jgi:hypothetical protein